MRVSSYPLVALTAVLAALGGSLGRASAASSTTVVTQPSGPSGNSVIRVIVNQQPVAFNGAGPVMVDGAVMVPVRSVFQQIGGRVQWHPKTQVVEGARPGHMFRLRVGSDQALVDGSERTLSTPPQLIDGTTYIPLRFASQALGARVAWQGAHRTVIITTGGVAGATGTTVTTTSPTGAVTAPAPPAPPNP